MNTQKTEWTREEIGNYEDGKDDIVFIPKSEVEKNYVRKEQYEQVIKDIELLRKNTLWCIYCKKNFAMICSKCNDRDYIKKEELWNILRTKTDSLTKQLRIEDLLSKQEEKK